MNRTSRFYYSDIMCITATPSHVLVLFLSSRRRHTRCGRDWSSDGCSSDLRSLRHDAELRGGAVRQLCRWERRSEERRVGKECRSRWSAYHKKKKDERGG